MAFCYVLTVGAVEAGRANGLFLKAKSKQALPEVKLIDDLILFQKRYAPLKGGVQKTPGVNIQSNQSNLCSGVSDKGSSIHMFGDY